MPSRIEEGCVPALTGAREPLVALDKVSKKFGSFVAVEPTDLTIEKGEFLAIMGSSGCGKTTMLRMLAGLEEPSGGEIRFKGQRLNDIPPWQRETPLVWQSLALFPFLSVRENVEFGLKMQGVNRAERGKRALDWLQRMQIAEFAERNVAQLSGGQRQRVALARSLVTRPELLLLDEPLSALDAHLKVRMQGVMASLQKELGITFVYVTHSKSEAFSMADRVVIMSRGRVEQIGKPVDIYRKPRNRFVAEFLGSANIFSGRVTGERDGWLAIETPEGSFLAPKEDLVSRHTQSGATFIVSDDRVSLTKSRPEGVENVIAGKVIGEEFIGATATIHLETRVGSAIKAQRSHEDLEHIEIVPGTELFASWQPSAAYILPGE